MVGDVDSVLAPDRGFLWIPDAFPLCRLAIADAVAGPHSLFPMTGRCNRLFVVHVLI